MADTIKIGNIELEKIYLGTSDDVKVYIGTVKLYPQEPSYDFKLHYTTSGGTEVTINCDERWSKPANSVLPTINLLEIGDCTTEIPTSGFTSKGGTTSKPHYYGLQICPKFAMSDSVTKINNYGMYAFRYTTAYTPTLEESVLSKNITYIGQMGLYNWKFGDISFPNNFSGFSGSFSNITASTITIGKNAYLASEVFSSISANTITIDDGFNNPTTNGLFSNVSANTINIGNGTLAARTGGYFVTNCVIQNLNINSNFDTNYPLFAKNRGTIKNVTYGNDVTVIGGNAFSGRTELSSVVIGNSVTNIGSYAFANCSSLTSIIINATTPPTLGGDAFNGSTCPIYVPAESVNAYKTASGWSTYASRIQAIPTLQWVSYTAGDTAPVSLVYGVKLYLGLGDDNEIDFIDTHEGGDISFVYVADADGWYGIDNDTSTEIDLSSYYDSSEGCYIVLFSDLGYGGLPMVNSEFEFDVQLLQYV